MAMRETFDELVNLAMQEPGRTHMRPAIEKELLHYDILFALNRTGLLNALTFQGGTSLRLCHGAPRFSEDLDFAGGLDFDPGSLGEMKRCLEAYLGSRYGLLVLVKEPKIQALTDARAGIDVAKWQIGIQTAPQRPDLPRQRIKLEVANIPAHTRELKSLARNYTFLPDGYSDVLIGVETLDEIMADKLVSLACCRRYVRHRDIWDLRWLKQQGAEIDIALVQQKITDYRESDYRNKLQEMIGRLPEITAGPGFKGEMSRFLPQDVQARTIGAAGFDQFLANEVGGLLSAVDRALEFQDDPQGPFRM